jgi:hypothetical protein
VDFTPVEGSPSPLRQDPAHPFVPNGTGRQPTYRIADLTNPNLKQWAKDIMKKDNDEVIAGKIASCPEPIRLEVPKLTESSVPSKLNACPNFPAE